MAVELDLELEGNSSTGEGKKSTRNGDSLCNGGCSNRCRDGRGNWSHNRGRGSVENTTIMTHHIIWVNNIGNLGRDKSGCSRGQGSSGHNLGGWMGHSYKSCQTSVILSNNNVALSISLAIRRRYKSLVLCIIWPLVGAMWPKLCFVYSSRSTNTTTYTEGSS